MAKSKADAKTKPNAGPPASSIDAAVSGSRLGRFLFRPRALIILAFVITSTAVVPFLAQFRPELADRPEYRLAASEIVVTPLPRWVPLDLVDRVVGRAEWPGELSLLDDGVVAEVAEGFDASPWVARVVSVRKSFPARIEVELEYRRPVAMVEVKQGLYPVDATGILLPPEDFAVSAAESYPLVRNVSSTPRGPAGTNWGDVAVVGAARLAAELTAPREEGGTPWRDLDLAAIRVSERMRAEQSLDDVSFELIAAGGSRILWGRAPGSDHPGELTAEQKVGRLESYHRDFGGFDRPQGPYEIDIRHWQEISRRRLSRATTEASIRR